MIYDTGRQIDQIDRDLSVRCVQRFLATNLARRYTYASVSCLVQDPSGQFLFYTSDQTQPDPNTNIISPKPLLNPNRFGVFFPEQNGLSKGQPRPTRQ